MVSVQRTPSRSSPGSGPTASATGPGTPLDQLLERASKLYEDIDKSMHADESKHSIEVDKRGLSSVEPPGDKKSTSERDSEQGTAKTHAEQPEGRGGDPPNALFLDAAETTSTQASTDRDASDARRQAIAHISQNYETQLDEQRKLFSSQMASLRTLLEKTKSEHEQERDHANAVHERVLEEAHKAERELRNEVRELREKVLASDQVRSDTIAAMQSKYEKEIAELGRRHRLHDQEREQQHENAVKALEQKYKEQAEQASNESITFLEEVRRNAKRADDEREGKLDELRSTYRGQVTKLQDLLASAEEQLAKTRDELDQVKARAARDLARQRTESAQSVAEAEERARDAEEKREAQHSEADALIRRLRDTLQKTEEAHALQIRKVKENHQSELQSAREKLQDCIQSTRAREMKTDELLRKSEDARRSAQSALAQATKKMAAMQELVEGEREQAKRSTATQREQIRQLQHRCAALEEELALCVKERDLAESESQRMQAQATSYKLEAERARSFLYGRKRAPSQPKKSR